MRYQENIQKKEGKHHANQYSAVKTDRTTIPDDPHGLHYGKDQIFKRRRQQSDLKDHSLSDHTSRDHSAFQVDYTPSIMKGLAVACIASVILQFLLLFVTWIMGKMFHLNTVEYTSAYYSNSGNLIVPLVTYILGKEWVIYGCVFMSVQLFFIWTHCKCKISGETEISLKKILLNINMISVFAGVFLFFTKIRFPEIIGNTLSSVGSMIGPLSMIVTGMLIAGVDLKKVFTNKRIYLVTFIRLVIEPIIALAVIILLGMKNWHPQAENIILITYMAAITPCASTITQMCQVYGNDSKYASAINVMTTLLAVVTMPVFVYFYMNL